jgi:FKBP-type peptidyl-prolyl cis-trans isomerase FkpA
MRQQVVALSIIAVLHAVSAGAAGPPLQTNEDKTVYAIGVVLSQSVAPLNLTPGERELLKAGFADGTANKKPKVDMKIFGPKIREFTQARTAKALAVEKQSTQSFLEQAAAAPGAEKKPSGLIYTELKAGDGQQPKPGDLVKVNYTGRLRDGSVFDSSAQRGQPAEFAMHGVIPCWSEALQLMKVHGKAKIVCPPELAYGDRGAPPRIKPGAALVFEIELLEVSPVGPGGHAVPGHAVPEHGVPEHAIPGHPLPGADAPAPAVEGSEKKE